MATQYVGYQVQGYLIRYMKYYDETIQDVPPHVHYAMANSPFPAGKLPSFPQDKLTCIGRNSIIEEDIGDQFSVEGLLPGGTTFTLSTLNSARVANSEYTPTIDKQQT